MRLPGIHSVVGGDVALQYMKVPRSRKTLPRPGRYTVGGSEGSRRPSKRPMPPAGLPPPGSGKGYGIGSDRGKKRPISPEVGPRRRAADGGGGDGGFDGGKGGGFDGGKGGGLDGGSFDGGEGGGFDGGKGGGFGGKGWQRQPRDLCWWMALEGKGKEAGKLLALPRRWKVNKDGEVVPRGRGAVNRGNSELLMRY